MIYKITIKTETKDIDELQSFLDFITDNYDLEYEVNEVYESED